MSNSRYIDSAPTKLSNNITQFLISYGKKKEYDKGRVLAQEGEASDTIFVILGGDVEVLKSDGSGRENVIAKVGQGTILGEMGVFLDQKRTGTLRAASDCQILEFSNEDFLNALKKLPELAFRLIKSLATRVSVANNGVLELLNNQAELVVGLEIMALRGDLKQKIGIVQINPDEFAETTGIQRRVIRLAIERFTDKGLLVGQRVSSDGTISIEADFAKLHGYLVSLPKGAV